MAESPSPSAQAARERPAVAVTTRGTTDQRGVDMVHATADTSTTDPESRLLPSQQFRLTVDRNDMARAEALLARVPSREVLL